MNLSIPELLKNFEPKRAPVPTLEDILEQKRAEVREYFAQERSLSHRAEKSALEALATTVAQDYEDLMAAYRIKDRIQYLIDYGIPDEYEALPMANRAIQNFSRKLGLL